MTDTINATQEVTVFVNLFRNEYERNGKKLISYKPGALKKGAPKSEAKTFPVGLGHYDIETEGEFSKNVYHKTYWLSASANEDDKGDVVITLNDTTNKSSYQNFYLTKTEKDGKASFGSNKPIEVNGQKYWVNLYKNTSEDRLHDLTLIFKEANGSDASSFGTSKDILFDDIEF